MGSVIYRKLEHLEEFRAFQSGYQEAFRGKKLSPNHPLKVEDLGSFTKVIGVFYKGQMVAGYVVNRSLQRTLGLLDDNVRMDVQDNLPPAHENCEIASVWSLRGFPKRKLNGLWMHLYKDVVSLKPKNIFSSCYGGHGMFKFYNIVRPTIVHHAKREDDNYIFYYSRMKFFIFRYLAFAPKRIRNLLSPFKPTAIYRILRPGV